MKSLIRILGIPELKKKIIFTFLMIIVCRLGVFLPVPGINGALALEYFKQTTGTGHNLFQLVDIFSGGAFAQMTVTALGVVPYISASIAMQLLIAVFPSLQRELRENPEIGKRKLSKNTRLLTVLLALLQSSLFARYALHMNRGNPGIILDQMLQTTFYGFPWLFFLVMVVTMTTGTIFLMWLGELISEKGIGNGMSIIIAVGIVASLPSTLSTIFKQLRLDSQEPSSLSFISLCLLCVIFVGVVIATILMIQAVKKIPIQHARRIVGRKEIQGVGSHLPLKVNYAGVAPVIFASSLLMFPATIARFLSNKGILSSIAMSLSPGSWVHTTLFVLLILFFTYFWTATQFHPEQIASEMKRNAAFIPGIKQGKPTQDYLEAAMSRVTFIGALGLAFIAILPTIVGKILHVDPAISYFFGGTTLLILVGVVIDTMKQIESHSMMHKYDGFLQRKMR